MDVPPVFSTKALTDHVAFLAAHEREGRGVGTKGLDDAAAEYIAERVQELRGSEPAGTDGYYQPFSIDNGPGGNAPAQVKNVIGVLRGTKPEWAQQAMVLSAHYDHLGRGWPDAHAGEAGKVHPGADDNASGVAVMLELARVLASGEKPQRTIVFAAFTGEEAGLRGSRYFVDHPMTAPLSGHPRRGQPRHGRPAAQRQGAGARAGTATEWQHIFRGGSFVTGVESTRDPGERRGVGPACVHREGDPGDPGVHGAARGLSPRGRFRRQGGRRQGW